MFGRIDAKWESNRGFLHIR